MFISYDIGAASEVPELDGYILKVVDSEFEDTTYIPVIMGGTLDGVIEIYEKRGLPVGPNLVKAIIYGAKRNDVSVKALVESYKRSRNSKIHQYEEDINKYLVLL